MRRQSTSSGPTARRVVERRKRETDFLLTHAYPVPSDFPEEFQKICKLRPFHVNQRGTSELQIQLGKIVYLYRRRFADKAYSTGIEECIRSSDLAAVELQRVFDRASKLDIGHIELVMHWATILDPTHFARRNYMSFLQQVMDSQVLMEVFSAALQVGVGISAAKPGKGRPRLPYFMPALELIDMWEELTGLKVVTPKGMMGEKNQREAIQPSTEFIRLSLRMIKADIRDSEVMTSIKNALNLRSQLNRLGAGKRHPITILRELIKTNSSASENGS